MNIYKNGIQFSATFVLDSVICQVAMVYTNKTGCELVNELAAALNNEEFTQADKLVRKLVK